MYWHGASNGVIEMTEEAFDLFVMGGGSGGVLAARIVSEHGVRVAIPEENRFGGTCVICGCVPRSSAVRRARTVADGAAYRSGVGGVNSRAMAKWSRRAVAMKPTSQATELRTVR